MHAVEVVLATGLEVAGSRQQAVWLRPWSGDDLVALGESQAREPLAVRTSELLGRCLSLDGEAPAGASVARRLTVGDREALLLHLHRLIHGDRLDLLAGCPRCGETLEFELRAQDLLIPIENLEPEPWVDLENGDGKISLQVRLLTGEDQELAARLAARDEAAGAEALLRASLAPSGADSGESLPDGLREALEEKLGEIDPQAEIRISATCPECGADLDLPLDAGELVHARIDRAKAELYRDVHVLARYYHWSEAEILSLPPERRRRYLEFLAEDGGKA